MTKEKLDALVREMDGCDAFICVAKFGDSAEVRAKGSLVSVMPLILHGIVSVTRQVAGGDDDLQQRYLKVAAAVLNTLAREGAAKEIAPEAAVTAPDIIRVIDEACKKYASYFDFDICSDTDEIIKYINYELPEIKVIDFTSTRIDSRQILESISADPWLHNGGIIAVVTDMEERKEIEEQKNANILIVQTKRQFADNFSRLLHILWLNQQFLFSRGMQGQLGTSESGSFICGNDPIDIQVYTSFLLNYLYSSNRIDTGIRSKLHTVLMELLFNALEHGNCGISYEEKTEWLEKGNDILALIKQKAQLDENKNSF